MTRCQRPFFAALPGYPESVLVPLEARPDFAPLDEQDTKRRGCRSQASYVLEHTHAGGTDEWYACGAHIKAALGARRGQTMDRVIRFDFGPSISVKGLTDADPSSR